MKEFVGALKEDIETVKSTIPAFFLISSPFKQSRGNKMKQTPKKRKLKISRQLTSPQKQVPPLSFQILNKNSSY